MKLLYRELELQLKYPFAISGYSRTSTPVVLLELSHDGFTGIGEASMVPYMGASFASANSFLNKLDLGWLSYPFDYGEVISYLDSVASSNPAIKAAIDIALHDLQGKIENKPCYQLFNGDPSNMPVTSLTIGMDAPEVIIKKVQDAEQAKVLKVKLGSEADKFLIETIRTLTDKPLYVDANQGWANKEKAVDLIFWLQQMGVELIEQPM